MFASLTLSTNNRRLHCPKKQGLRMLIRYFQLFRTPRSTIPYIEDDLSKQKKDTPKRHILIIS